MPVHIPLATVAMAACVSGPLLSTREEEGCAGGEMGQEDRV